jgi:uncharacterized membrane protein YphA (DoxX/SURF4 family)
VSDDVIEIGPAEDGSSAATDTSGRDPPSLLGRLLFGGVLAFMAVDNFRALEERIGYADAKGVPEADTLVPFTSGMLLVGSLGVTLWRLPRIATGAVAGFLAGVTPVMHDFWTVDDEGQRQTEQFQFFKNVAMLGAAVAFLERAWRN